MQKNINDFAEVSKIVDAGATSKPVIDYELSRYACYNCYYLNCSKDPGPPSGG